MTDTNPHPAPSRITRYWRWARTPLLTASATAGLWLANGVVHEIGARIIEWLW